MNEKNIIFFIDISRKTPKLQETIRSQFRSQTHFSYKNPDTANWISIWSTSHIITKKALLDGCCHIRPDENDGRPLLKTDHPVLEAGKRDEGGLYCENISSDTLNWKASIARSFGLKVAWSSTAMALDPWTLAVAYSPIGLLQYLSILVLYSYRDSFLSPQIVCDWRPEPQNSRIF